MGRNGAGRFGNAGTGAGEDVRCYCNQPACVALGYMCRAPPGGGCYSELPATDIDFSAAMYGCLHHVVEGYDGEFIQGCQNSPGKSGFSSPNYGGKQNSLLLCCFSDLCNHVDSPNTKLRLNDSVAGALGNRSDGSSDDGAINSAEIPAPGYANSEVWFKAATIAVPICGFLILFMLVALAIRLLKSDSLDSTSNKLSSTYLPHSPSYSQSSIIVKKPLEIQGSAVPLLMPRTILNDDNRNTIMQTYCLNNEIKSRFPLLNSIANNTFSDDHFDHESSKIPSHNEKIINTNSTSKYNLKDVNVNLVLIDETSNGQIPDKLYNKESLVIDNATVLSFPSESLQ